MTATPYTAQNPNSFAYFTYANRIPVIINAIINNNAQVMTIAQQEKLLALSNSFPQGSIQYYPSIDAEADQSWKDFYKNYQGMPITHAPFLEVESYFYHAIASTILSDPENRISDWFQTPKITELAKGMPRFILAAAALEKLSGPEKVTAALRNALWANKADLSQLHKMQGDNNDANLIIDKTNQVVGKLLSPATQTISYVLDNSGEELFHDLQFIAELSKANPAIQKITVGCKRYPTFVSDATRQDIAKTIQDCKTASPELKQTMSYLQEMMTEGHMVLDDNIFYNAPLSYHHAGPALFGYDAVIFKGDLNYRRVVGDISYRHEEKIENVAAEIPAACILLRTCKSELVVNMAQGQAQSLDAQDPKWRVNGTKGIIDAYNL